MISGIIVGVLIAIVATLGVTTWWVRVRRVAKLYQVAAVHTWPRPTEQQADPNTPRALLTSPIC